MNAPELIDSDLDPSKAMSEPMSFQQFVGAGALEPALLELVKLLVSQLLPCANGVARYRRRALLRGERWERVRILSRWQESRVYTDRERAAFSWAEALVRVPASVPDNIFRIVREWFTEEELRGLTESILATIAWSRSFAVGERRIS